MDTGTGKEHGDPKTTHRQMQRQMCQGSARVCRETQEWGGAEGKGLGYRGQQELGVLQGTRTPEASGAVGSWLLLWKGVLPATPPESSLPLPRLNLGELWPR